MGSGWPQGVGKQCHYLFGTGILGWHARGVPEFPVPDEPCVLLKLGEIVLKGRNRQQFEHILHGNIRVAVRDLGLPVDLRQREGVILLRVADGEQRGEEAWTQAVNQVAERMRDVPGIARVCLPLRVAKFDQGDLRRRDGAHQGHVGACAVRARAPATSASRSLRDSSAC